MRILCLSTWYPYPPDNGSRLRAHYLVQALGVSHEVSVVSFHPRSRVAHSDAQSTPVGSVQVHAVPANPFRYVALPSFVKYLSPIPVAAWPSVAMRRAVSGIASEIHWDAVVAFQTPVGQYALLPRASARIFDLDNSFSLIARDKVLAQASTLSRLKARVSLYKTYRYETRLLRKFHTCTVVSPLEADYARHMAGGPTPRVAVIGNGVDCSHNLPSLVSTRPGTLVYNGALTYSANYDAMRWFLADVYPRIRREKANASLMITGSTSGVALDNLALDETVRLTGHVEDVRLPVAEAEVCVAPIRQGGGTRLKILEAMALGTPVVSTTKGAEGLEVEHERHLLIADGPVEFARATVRLLENEELRRTLAFNARKVVEERYDWERTGKSFVELVEQTVANQRSLPG